MGSSHNRTWGEYFGSFFSWGSKKKSKCPEGQRRDHATHTCVANVVSEFNDYAAGSEPDWTKKIPGWVICDWFYLFFVVNVFILVILLSSILYMGLSSTLPKNVRMSTIFMLVIQLMASGTSTLFYYLLCDRTLKPSA